MAQLSSEDISKATKKANEEEENKSSPAEPLDVDINDSDALRSLAKGKLVEILQTAPVNISLVAAIKELLDRVDGKPGQAITVDANLKVVTVNANINFIQSTGDKLINGDVDNLQVIDN